MFTYELYKIHSDPLSYEYVNMSAFSDLQRFVGIVISTLIKVCIEKRFITNSLSCLPCIIRIH